MEVRIQSEVSSDIQPSITCFKRQQGNVYTMSSTQPQISPMLDGMNVFQVRITPKTTDVGCHLCLHIAFGQWQQFIQLTFKPIEP